MNKLVYKVLLIIAIFALNVQPIDAQSNWSQCRDNRAIVRCETYDCPKGDSNNDGKCTLEDDDARLTDARNDSFCANPISGCGQVHYYPSGSAEACLVRAEEGQMNCELYAVADVQFTPQPTTSASPRATATATPRATASASPSTKGGLQVDDELPKTGSEHIWLGGAVLLLGAVGVYLYEKYKTI